MHKRARSLAFLLLATTVVAACGKSDKAGDKGKQPDKPAAAADAAAAAAPEPPPTSPPAAAAPTLEGLINQEADALVKLLGEPKSKDELAERGADGIWYSFWKWPDQGLTISMESGTKDGPLKSASVEIEAPSTLKTEAGVGLGASADEVKQAYGDKINKEESNDERIIAGGDLYGGTFFRLGGGKVTSIFIGSAAE